jgi:Phage related hypothetical protein (DUF1799)
LASFGFLPSDFKPEEIEVWPEHVQAVDLFQTVATQWRIGTAGATGLDYGVLFEIMARMDLGKDRWRELLDEIRVMEGAALAEMHRKE